MTAFQDYTRGGEMAWIDDAGIVYHRVPETIADRNGYSLKPVSAESILDYGAIGHEEGTLP